MGLLAGLAGCLLAGLVPSAALGVGWADSPSALVQGLEREEAVDCEPLVADLEVGLVPLNRAAVEDVLSLPGMSEEAAYRVAEYRTRRGALESVQELAHAGVLEPETVEAISAFVTLAPRPDPLKVSVASRSRALFGSSDTAGALGDASLRALKLYHRTTVSLGDRAQAALLADKDHGEDSLGDFVAGYLEVRETLGLDRIVLGDFRPAFAQGVLFGRYFGVGISPVKQKPPRGMGYRSSAENDALRGALVFGSVGHLRVTVLGSRAQRDARMNQEGTIEALLESGLHVTESEKAGRDALTETCVAGRAAWVARRVNLGVTVAGYGFDPAWGPSDWEEKRFAFRGSRQTLVGVDWDVILPPFNGFGEIAASWDGAYAAVVGVVSERKPVSLRLLARTYAADFYAPDGTPFFAKEGANERGVYSELGWRLNAQGRVTVFLDQYRRPWRTVMIPVPVVGSNLGATLQYRVRRDLRAYLKYGSRLGQEYETGDGGLADRRSRYAHADLTWRPHEALGVHGRVARSWVCCEGTVPSERGALLFGDVHVAFFGALTLDAGLALFDTDSWAARIYVFEDDLEGVYASRAVYGRGSRGYALLKQRLGPWAVSARYSLERARPRADSDERAEESRLGLQVDLGL